MVVPHRRVHLRHAAGTPSPVYFDAHLVGTALEAVDEWRAHLEGIGAADVAVVDITVATNGSTPVLRTHVDFPSGATAVAEALFTSMSANGSPVWITTALGTGVFARALSRGDLRRSIPTPPAPPRPPPPPAATAQFPAPQVHNASLDFC